MDSRKAPETQLSKPKLLAFKSILSSEDVEKNISDIEAVMKITSGRLKKTLFNGKMLEEFRKQEDEWRESFKQDLQSKLNKAYTIENVDQASVPYLTDRQRRDYEQLSTVMSQIKTRLDALVAELTKELTAIRAATLNPTFYKSVYDVLLLDTFKRNLCLALQAAAWDYAASHKWHNSKEDRQFNAIFKGIAQMDGSGVLKFSDVLEMFADRDIDELQKILDDLCGRCGKQNKSLFEDYIRPNLEKIDLTLNKAFSFESSNITINLKVRALESLANAAAVNAKRLINQLLQSEKDKTDALTSEAAAHEESLLKSVADLADDLQTKLKKVAEEPIVEDKLVEVDAELKTIEALSNQSHQELQECTQKLDQVQRNFHERPGSSRMSPGVKNTLLGVVTVGSLAVISGLVAGMIVLIGEVVLPTALLIALPFIVTALIFGVIIGAGFAIRKINETAAAPTLPETTEAVKATSSTAVVQQILAETPLSKSVQADADQAAKKEVAVTSDAAKASEPANERTPVIEVSSDEESESDENNNNSMTTNDMNNTLRR